MTIKKSILGLQNPVASANAKYLSLIHTSSDLIRYVMGVIKFSTANHLMALREERRDEKKSGMRPMKPNSRD